MKNDKVIILAAGIGSRLSPITSAKPKGLVKVNNKSILEHQIEAYLGADIKEENIYISVGYKAEMIESFIRNKYNKINIISNDDYLDTNNMYSLYLALKKISFKKGDSLFLSNGDCVYAPKIISSLKKDKRENLISCDIGKFNDESMKLTVDKNKRIIDIAKTIEEKDSYAISADLYKMSSHTVEKLQAIISDYIEEKQDLMRWTEASFPELFEHREFYCFDVGGQNWIEIDNYEDLSVADYLFSDFSLKKKKALIVDLDGTIYLGNESIQGAIDFIINNKNKYEIYFLTNNTSKTPSDYVYRLSNYGIKITEKNLLSPLHILISTIKSKKIKSIYLVANKVVTSYLQKKLPDVVFSVTDSDCEAVIVTYDTELEYKKLKTASILLNSNPNIKYWATHADVVCPTEDGDIPDIGSILNMLESSTKRRPDTIFGKPNPKILQEVLSNYKKEQIAIAGDRLYTDKVLADNVGCDFICVLSGEATRSDVENEETQPSITIKDLGYL